MLDTPTIASSSYNATAFAMNAAGAIQPLGGLQGGAIGNAQLFRAMTQGNPQHQHQPQQQEIVPMATRRLVKVVIIDPNDNVPLEDCVLFSGDEKLTDATDQELFFEIDINNILKIHNAKRVKLIDKKVKERTENLEPAKIRDLKMVVVNVASF